MVWETTVMEVDNQISLPESNLDRPERFLCTDCGRKFTKLGLVYHKKTCTEKEDCICAVCAISDKVSEKTNFSKTLLEKNKEKKDSHKNSSKEVIQAKVNSNDKNEDSTLNVNGVENISESNCNMTVLPILEESQVVPQPLEESQTVLQPLEESPTALAPLEDSQIVNSSNLENKIVYESQSLFDTSEFGEEHGGVNCTRKMFCNICKKHIFWQIFGVHILQHSKKLEYDYLRCPRCVKTFSRPTMLLLHYFIHASNHPLDCSDCRCSYNHCNDMTTRTVTEHCYAGNYHCYICLKIFTHEQSIANHMRLHSKEMPFTCTECNRSFRQVGNLQRHMTTHRGERPHQCRNCCRSFADPATLRNHMRVHTGETPYVCTLCKRGFTQIGNLKRHLALHLKNETAASHASSEVSSSQNGITLNTKIFEDEDKVNEKVRSSTTVAEAMDSDSQKETAAEEKVSSPSPSDPTNISTVPVKSKPVNSKSSRGRKKNGKFKIFPCPACNKIYTWKHDLQVHYRTHTGEKPYSCQLCGKRFAQSGAVRTHLARHHSGKPKHKKKDPS